MSKYLKYFIDRPQTIEHRRIYKNKKYKISHKISIMNIQIDEIHLSTGLNINNIHTKMYDEITNIKFDCEVFREAYINQRKQYKLLQAYIDLSNELISEDKYDEIEKLCTITINDYNEEISQKAIYRFLKNHRDYVEDYEANELSEILGLSYKKVNKLIKKYKKNG